MSQRWRGWIPVVIFWAAFLVSVGLGKHYSWIKTVWYAAGILFLLGLSVYSLVYKFRHRHETGGISYQGIPRSLQGFFHDEKDSDEAHPTMKVDSK
jgi:hypothetical protein